MCLELHHVFGDLQVQYRQLNYTRVWIDEHNRTAEPLFRLNDKHCDCRSIGDTTPARLPHASKWGLPHGKGGGEKKDRSKGESHPELAYAVNRHLSR